MDGNTSAVGCVTKALLKCKGCVCRHKHVSGNDWDLKKPINWYDLTYRWIAPFISTFGCSELSSTHTYLGPPNRAPGLMTLSRNERNRPRGSLHFEVFCQRPTWFLPFLRIAFQGMSRYAGSAFGHPNTGPVIVGAIADYSFFANDIERWPSLRL